MSTPPAGDVGFSRAAGVALVLVQCVTLAWLELGHAFAAVAGGLALLSLWDRLRIEPKQSPHWLWFALLGLILLIKHRFSPELLPDQITFVNTELAFEIARFLIFVQVVQLFVRREAGRTPVWPAAVAVASMVFASDVRLNTDTRAASMVLCLAFVALFGLYSASVRRRVVRGRSLLAWGATAATLGLAVAAGWGTSTALRRYEENLESFLTQSGMGSPGMVAAGFSGGGELGEISGFKQEEAVRVALRVIAERRPGYLRGAVFDQYDRSAWTSLSEQRNVLPGPKPVDAPRQVTTEYYQIGEAAGGGNVASQAMDFRPAPETGSRLFLPRDVVSLALDEVVLQRSSNGLITRPMGAGGPYAAVVADQSFVEDLAPIEEHRCLSVPDGLQAFLAPLAGEVFADCRTSQEKCSAVVRFFRNKFEYELRAHAPRRRDAVEYFLSERPPGHCEFFAASGALLLRMAGVPTRYVTGFVATEHNDVGGFWVARRRDAHAWIEAYDNERRQWVTVECTPEAGVPAERDVAAWQEWVEAQRHLYDEWLLAMTRDGLLGFLSGLVQILLSVPGLVLLVLIGTGLFLWGRRHVIQRPRRPAAPFRDPVLSRQLVRADRYARRLGFERRPHETLSAFAARVRAGTARPDAPHRAVADWYDDYVRVRYGVEDPAVAGAALATRLVHLRAARLHRP